MSRYLTGFHGSGFTSSPLTVVDDFEDGDIAEYALETGSFSVQTSTIYSGSNALEASFEDNFGRHIVSTDFSVSNGKTYRWNVQLPTTDVTGSAVFGVEDESSIDGYQIEAQANESSFNLAEFEEGSRTLLSQDTDVTYSTGIWYEVEFDWGSSGGLTATLYDDGGSQVTQISATDSTFSSGGIGWHMFNSTTTSRSVFYDYMREV